MSAAPRIDAPFLLGMMRLHEVPELHAPGRLGDWIEARLDEGLAWFDHADIYGDGQGEALFGAALRAERIAALAQDADLTLARPDWYALLEAARGHPVA